MFFLSYFVASCTPTAATSTGAITPRSQVSRNTLGAVVFFCYIFAALFFTGYLVIDIIRVFQKCSTRRDQADKQAAESTERWDENKAVRAAISLKTQQNGSEDCSSRRAWAAWFSALAIASFTILSWNMLRFLITSYIEWADKPAVCPYALQVVDLYETRQFLSSIWFWATESNLFQTFAEDLLVDPRNWKQVQMALLYTYVWNVWMSTLGANINTPHLWMYFALGQILPVSFAQNLFCAALMLDEIPSGTSQSSDGVRLTRTTMTVVYVATLFFMPAAISTSWFFPLLFVLRVLLLVPFGTNKFSYRGRGAWIFGNNHGAQRSDLESLLILAVYGLYTLSTTQQAWPDIHGIPKYNYAAATLRNDLVLGVVSSISLMVMSR